MTYPFDGLWAIDPLNPTNVAQNAEITIHAVGDGTRTPLDLTDNGGSPTPNPVYTNEDGFVGSFRATIPRVAWYGGDAEGSITSWEGLKEDVEASAQAAQGAQQSAESSASSAQDAANSAGLPAGEAVKVAISIGGAARPILDEVIGKVAGKREPTAIFPAPSVSVYGDSTTESIGTDWPVTHLAPYTGLTVKNLGASGQGAADILLRAGAFRPPLTLAGDTIPASEAAVVTTIDPVEGWRVGGSGSFAFTGSLVGIKGSLVHNMTGESWSFERTEPGDLAQVKPGTPFIRDPELANPLDRLILWVGRNNVVPNTLHASSGLASLLPDAQDTEVKELLVLGVINSTGEGEGTANHKNIVAYNKRLETMYGDRYLDIRRAFIDDGLTRAGIAATPTDTANIAADRPPESLMHDNIHPNAVGYEIIARLIAEKMLEIGWTNSLTTPDDADPAEPAVVITSDSFNRADTSPGSLGSTDAAYGGSSKAWTSEAQLQILSNQVGATTLSVTRMAHVDTGANDHYAEVKIGSALEGGLVARYTDSSNHYTVRLLSSGKVALDARVAGDTVPLEETPTAVVASGDVLGLEVVGSRIRAYVNNELVSERAEYTGVPAGTRAGIRSAWSNTGFRLDDFKVYDKKPI